MICLKNTHTPKAHGSLQKIGRKILRLRIGEFGGMLEATLIMSK